MEGIALSCLVTLSPLRFSLPSLSLSDSPLDPSLSLSIYLFGCFGSLSPHVGSMWALVPQPETEPGPLALGTQNLSSWTTREVPTLLTWSRLPLHTAEVSSAFKGDSFTQSFNRLFPEALQCLGALGLDKGCCPLR